jgi:hypothetical protein
VPDDHGSREVTLWTVTWTDDRPELSARTVVIDEYGCHPVSVDRSGRLVMAACRAAANEHPSLHYGSWPSSGSASTGLLVRGQGPHLKCRGNVPCSAPDARNGWGDYNGIALDPDDESTAWVFGGVGHETDKSLWATGIVALHP